jgi:hypothetical protein
VNYPVASSFWIPKIEHAAIVAGRAGGVTFRQHSQCLNRLVTGRLVGNSSITVWGKSSPSLETHSILARHVDDP